MNETLELASHLIQQASITPDDQACQSVLRERLSAIGFTITDLSAEGTTNTWAQRGQTQPLLVFSGHTDVVPPGPLHQWISPPFEPTQRDGKLYGRGSADMKAALAAMVTATERFYQAHDNPAGSIAFMITSDEEGTGEHGTKRIVEHCHQTGIHVDWCLIGEATSQETLGDGIKVGRRGSLHGRLKVLGKQGHIAYPHLADNPIHRSFKALDTLTQTVWDDGNAHFQPTACQIYNINADTGATNIIPGSLTASFNFRYGPSSTADDLISRVHAIFDAHELDYQIEWERASEPFYSPQNQLLPTVKKAIAEICGIDTLANTLGGTSDGRHIAALGCEIVELGAINASIHQVNEHIAVDDIDTLSRLYERILEQLLLPT